MCTSAFLLQAVTFTESVVYLASERVPGVEILLLLLLLCKNQLLHDFCNSIYPFHSTATFHINFHFQFHHHVLLLHLHHPQPFPHLGRPRLDRQSPHRPSPTTRQRRPRHNHTHARTRSRAKDAGRNSTYACYQLCGENWKAECGLV